MTLLRNALPVVDCGAQRMSLVAPLVRATMANAFFAYSDNYLIDTDHGIIMDVDASRSNKTAEVGAMRKMLDRTEERFGVKPDWIAADTAYGSSDTLVWLALKRQILPFIPVFHCPAGHCKAMS